MEPEIRDEHIPQIALSNLSGGNENSPTSRERAESTSSIESLGNISEMFDNPEEIQNQASIEIRDKHISQIALSNLSGGNMNSPTQRERAKSTSSIEEQALAPLSSQLALFGNEAEGQQTMMPVDISEGRFENAQLGGHRTYNMTKKENISGDIQYGTRLINVHTHYYGASPQTQAEENKNTGDVFRLTDCIQIHKDKPLNKSRTIFHGEQISTVTSARPLAIKLIPYDEKYKQEAKLLLKLNQHPNVVSIIHSDVCRQGPMTSIYIAMELCHKQNLHYHVTERKNVPFDSQLSISQAKQLVEGLNFIHENDIIHRDLKPHNVLFSIDKKTIKIADFGISKPMTGGRTVTNVTNAQAGTDGYRAPETYNSNEISKQADIFSLGLVFYFLWSNGHHAFGDDPDDWNSNIKKNRDRDLSQLQLGDQEMAMDVLQWSLQFNTKERPKAAQILNHKIFGGTEISPKQQTSPKEVGSSNPITAGKTFLVSGHPRYEPTTQLFSSIARKIFPAHRLKSPEVGSFLSNVSEKTFLGSGHTKLQNRIPFKLATSSVPSSVPRKEFLPRRSKPPDKSPWRHRDSEKEIDMEKMISLKKKSELYMKHFEYQSAYKILKELQGLQRDSWKQFETLQQIIECLIMTDQPCDQEMNEVITTSHNLRLSPRDIHSIAEKYFEDDNLIRSYIMFHSTGKMQKTGGGIEALTKCVSRMDDIVTKIVKRPRYRRVAIRFIIPAMKELLEDLCEMDYDSHEDKTIKEADCLLFIGSGYHELSEYESAGMYFLEGTEVLRRELGESAYKYRLFSSLLNNTGSAYFYLGHHAEALSYHEEAVYAAQLAEDFSDEEHRQKSIDSFMKNINTCSRHTGLSQAVVQSSTDSSTASLNSERSARSVGDNAYNIENLNSNSLSATSAQSAVDPTTSLFQPDQPSTCGIHASTASSVSDNPCSSGKSRTRNVAPDSTPDPPIPEANNDDIKEENCMADYRDWILEGNELVDAANDILRSTQEISHAKFGKVQPTDANVKLFAECLRKCKTVEIAAFHVDDITDVEDESFHYIEEIVEKGNVKKSISMNGDCVNIVVQEITPQGGEIRIRHCVITFPHGAVSKNTTFILRHIVDPKTEVVLDGFTEITPAITCTPAVKFHVPIHISLTTWVELAHGKHEHCNVFEMIEGQLKCTHEKPILNNRIEFFTQSFEMVCGGVEDKIADKYSAIVSYFLCTDDERNFVSVCCMNNDELIEKLKARWRKDGYKIIFAATDTIKALFDTEVLFQLTCADNQEGLKFKQNEAKSVKINKHFRERESDTVSFTLIVPREVTSPTEVEFIYKAGDKDHSKLIKLPVKIEHEQNGWKYVTYINPVTAKSVALDSATINQTEKDSQCFINTSGNSGGGT